MILKPIQIQNLCLSFPHKTCFEDFTTQIYYGSRIAIIGRNGSGKSTLLKILQGMYEPTNGDIKIPEDAVIGYVPQVIEDYDTLSGGQRLNQAITAALARDPNVLLLDEPTNHLDLSNRKSLMRMLSSYAGTLIVVSHDRELLRNLDTLWHIDNGKIHLFSGTYDDYIRERNSQRASIEKELSILNRQKKDAHHALMKEQERASKSKSHGEKKYAHEKLALNAARSRGEGTFNKNKKMIGATKDNLLAQMSNLRLPEVIVPKFSLIAEDVSDRILLSISNGSIGYDNQQPLLKNINLSLSSKERLAITGDNGSGKSTLLRAILGDPHVLKTGDWHLLKREDMGYLDQHYVTLSSDKSALECISELVPSWPHAEVRRHLNDFLFRKNEEVNAAVRLLSGGEKARLSLAQIAAKTPKLLMLDEITNNLDLETRQHIIEVLQEFPGSMIVISHDQDFLQRIGLTDVYSI
jgi:ATPase subunit of ABC transporter with duplicated ATPase domains